MMRRQPHQPRNPGRQAPRPGAERRRRGMRRALTLAELSVSLAVIATLMVATGSIMVLTGRSVAITAAQAAEARTDDVLTTFAAEHRMALSVTERTPTSITFTVADRDGDGVPETIRYAWSGNAGDPLTRQVNGAAPVVVARDVRKFGLGYVSYTQPGPATVPQVESTTDQVVYSHEGGSTAAFTLSTSNWASQSFVANLGRPDATSWRVTQVQVMGTRALLGATATITVGLYPADADGKPPVPLPAAIEKRTVSALVLPSSTGWSQVVTFSDVNQALAPTGRYCVIVSQSSLTGAGSVSLDASSSDANGTLCQTTTAGGSWSKQTTRDMRIRVYGRYKYPAP